MSGFKGIGIWPFNLEIWNQKLAVILFTHYRIELGKMKNLTMKMVNKTGQNI
jgi:hypothetical protein